MLRVAMAVAGVLGLALSASGAGMVPFAISETPPAEPALVFPSEPIPPGGPRLVVRRGHFAVGPERVRIWGVNVCFGACVPPKETAAAVARRLAAAGVNSVRFHHMDSQPWPRGLLDPKNRLRLVPEALERLDYFIDQLARRGIWANINLHVGRSASRALGLPDPGTRYDKVVGLFTPALIEAQQRYARDLLGRVNTVRKVRYADDAAVAFVEITNEDSLFMWSADRDLRTLPDYYADILRDRFNAWLKKRYGSTDALRRAWAEGAEPLGENLLADVRFRMAPPTEKGAPRWQLEQHAGCRMRAVPLEGRAGVRLEIAKADDVSWHLMLKQAPLKIRGGRYYTLRFRARAVSADGGRRTRRLYYSVGQNGSPWRNLGLSGRVDLGPEWREVRAGFVASADEEDARLAFSLGGSDVAVELADVCFSPGGRVGLAEGESLERANVAVFRAGETEPRIRDRWRFLAETEKAYFDRMRRFLKEDLGVGALVTGTIVFGPCGLWGQSGMDYIDGHAYWQHPRFPGRPWDPNNWFVEQSAMVDHPVGSTLPRLAAQRLAGKPYTVSEYNHPAPNDYQAECVPMIASFAAAQDWDGIWLFTYESRPENQGEARFHGYFDIRQNSAKWGFVRAGAEIFRRAAVPPLPRERRVGLAAPDRDTLDDLVALHRAHGRDLFSAVVGQSDMAWSDLLGERLAVVFSGPALARVREAGAGPTLAWTVAEGRGTYAVSAPGARVLVGHRGSRGAGVALREPAFAAVTMTALDGRPLEAARWVLVTACGRCENAGMQFSEDRRTVGRNWGGPPVGIEPVEAVVDLPPGRWTAWALGPDGSRTRRVPVEAAGADGTPSLRLAPAYRTMWYLLERRP